SRSAASTSCFKATAATDIYTLSLHDALPIYRGAVVVPRRGPARLGRLLPVLGRARHTGGGDARPGGSRGEDGAAPLSVGDPGGRSEEHTSELQSRENLVCRLLLEKKKRAATK